MPTIREIASHFGFKSPRSVSDHLSALRRKGYLTGDARKARSLRFMRLSSRLPVEDIPLLRRVPPGNMEIADFALKRYVSIDSGTLGFRPTRRTFALEVVSIAMTGRCIVQGDIIIVEQGRAPEEGDAVIVTYKGEESLKIYTNRRGRGCLQPGNVNSASFIPIHDVIIHGVILAVFSRTSVIPKYPRGGKAVNGESFASDRSQY